MKLSELVRTFHFHFWIIIELAGMKGKANNQGVRLQMHAAHAPAAPESPNPPEKE